MTTTLPPKSLSRNLRIGEMLNHSIVVLTRENAYFWSQSDEDLLAELNADVAETLEKFQGNYNLAVALNASQDALNVRDSNGNPVYPLRAPTERGRSDIGFADGAFFIIPPPVEVTEEPSPEPAE